MYKLLKIVFLCLTLLSGTTNAASIQTQLHMEIALTLLLTTIPQLEEIHRLAGAITDLVISTAPAHMLSLVPQLIPLFENPGQQPEVLHNHIVLHLSQEGGEGVSGAAAVEAQQIAVNIPLTIELPVTIEQIDDEIDVTTNCPPNDITQSLITQLTSGEVQGQIEQKLSYSTKE